MYKVEIPQFQGPFDLLLGLIQKEKLDITEIALGQVTDQFLQHIKEIEEIRPDELADFLSIAARLIFIKSKILLPEKIFEQDEEDEDEEDLLDQLRLYRQYASAARQIGKIFNNPYLGFSRCKIFENICPSSPFTYQVNPQALRNSFQRFLDLRLKQKKLITAKIKKRIFSLKNKIKEMLSFLSQNKNFIFNKIIATKSRAEKSIMFLAALELLKEDKIEIEQKGLFQEIKITAKKNI
ncbi:segregation/condensation protein A [Patescibacteria group bacterium]|nr:segregation/condensation protein A [Patescibacteria group bacterium]